MKKLLLITMLALLLQASQCWNLEKKDWISFEWAEWTGTLANGIEDSKRLLYVYPIYDGKIACYYLDSDFR
tara:strand:+ start:1454 stop:1666 length:213 start_codon:yes stop_codon:yes gene_type:complete